MNETVIALVILVPIAGVFVFAGIHEYRRFASEGRSNYGLKYDESTGTSYVSTLPDESEGYDPQDFDPNNYQAPERTDDAGAEEKEDDARPREDGRD